MANKALTYMFMGRDVSLSSTANKAGKNVESSFASIGGKVGTLAATMGKATAAAGAVFGAAAIKQGIQYNANLEQAQVGFTTMLGSGQKASTFLRDLQKFAAKTPFNFPELVTASERMIAFGFSAKDVIPNLTAIGDAAAGLGIGSEGVNQITNAIGQMQAKTKVQSDEILQLTEAGVPALRILANEYGVTTGKMQDMITQGVVKSSDAIPKLLQGIEKGTKGAAGATTKFGGLMAEQSKTLKGVWSNFVDVTNMKLGQLVAPAMPAIKAGLGWLTDTISGKGSVGQAVTNLADKFKGAFSSALPAIKQAADNISDVIGPVLRAFMDYVTGTVGPMISKVFGAIRDVLRTYAPLFRDIGNWVATAVFPVLKDVGRIFTTVIVPIVKRFFELAMPGFRDLFGALKSVWGSVKILWDALKPFIGPILVVALGVVVGAFRGIAWVLNNVVAPAIRGVANFIGGIVAIVKAVVRQVRLQFDMMELVILNAFKAVVHTVANVAGWLHLPFADSLKKADKALGGWIASTQKRIDSLNGKTVNVQVITKAQSAAIAAGFAGVDRSARRATGGHVRGPGTSTSDSIPAWLSDNEYVMQSSAVNKYGVGFMAAVNAGQFAAGGLAKMGVKFAGTSVAVFGKALDSALLKTVASMFTAIGSGSVGGGVSRWSGVVLQALALLGQSSAWLSTVLRRINQESGGNQFAINLWDSNARAGDPSRGLMQTIGATFAAFAGPFRNLGIYHPLANIYAGLNYALHRYGTLYALNRPGGYDFGGVLKPGLTMAYNGTGHNEYVVNPALARGGGTVVNYHNNVTVNAAPGTNPREVGRQVVEAIKAYEMGSGKSWRS